MKEVTEFVRVTDSIFDLRDKLNHGKLYAPRDGMINDFIKIDDESTLMIKLGRGQVFMEVNRVDTWKDYAIELINGSSQRISSLDYNALHLMINKNPQLIIKLSHLIASMTEKPDVD